MSVQRWKRKARALARLAEDQRGKPEGELARQKLLEIINAHPEAKDYEPVVELIQRDIEWVFTTQHLRAMKMAGISTDGSWTGATFDDALRQMIADYKARLTERMTPAPIDAKMLKAAGDALAGEDQQVEQ